MIRSAVWAVTGATRGLGLEYCKQVNCTLPGSLRASWTHSHNTLQILALPGTKVIAGARPGENQDDLKLLSDQNEGRLLPVQMELLDKDSVKVTSCCSGSIPIFQLPAAHSH